MSNAYQSTILTLSLITNIAILGLVAAGLGIFNGLIDRRFDSTTLKVAKDTFPTVITAVIPDRIVSSLTPFRTVVVGDVRDIVTITAL
jgi:hypothetical protein